MPQCSIGSAQISMYNFSFSGNFDAPLKPVSFVASSSHDACGKISFSAISYALQERRTDYVIKMATNLFSKFKIIILLIAILEIHGIASQRGKQGSC